MKKANSVLGRNLLLTTAVIAALAVSGAHAQTPPEVVPESGKPAVSPLPSTTPPEIVKPVPPSELKSADAVFNELDSGRRGYVTRAETKDLIGFGKAFRTVDKKGSGKLTRAQFRKAWAIYKAGNK